MAANWTQSIVCRYYKNGICREGENCRYNHAQTGTREISGESEEIGSTGAAIATCLFFKSGNCMFGTRCRFAHQAENDAANANRNKQPQNANSRRGESSVAGSHTLINSDTKPVASAIIQDNIKAKTILVDEWVNAPEFVSSMVIDSVSKNGDDNASSTSARPASYARAVCSSSQTMNSASEPLCPYAEASGICKKIDCPYLHGLTCEMCSRAALHPFNDELRQQHTNACVKQHEADMELSFAIQRSRDKSCGVCFEVIMEKSIREQRFGILPNCNHCFCLSCIRKWRQAKQFDNKIIRSCPECRVPSDFVCPSTYWVDTKEEKEKLIVEYKEALSLKDCKYFNKGRGKCPFGNKCFYLHALPDGTKTDVGPPVRQQPIGEDDFELIHPLILWNFREQPPNAWLYMNDRDSEESDWSE